MEQSPMVKAWKSEQLPCPKSLRCGCEIGDSQRGREAENTEDEESYGVENVIKQPVKKQQA
jgi:hypothetical protein